MVNPDGHYDLNSARDIGYRALERVEEEQALQYLPPGPAQLGPRSALSGGERRDERPGVRRRGDGRRDGRRSDDDRA